VVPSTVKGTEERNAIAGRKQWLFSYLNIGYSFVTFFLSSLHLRQLVLTCFQAAYFVPSPLAYWLTLALEQTKKLQKM
jgi:hypothetical protein